MRASGQSAEPEALAAWGRADRDALVVLEAMVEDWERRNDDARRSPAPKIVIRVGSAVAYLLSRGWLRRGTVAKRHWPCWTRADQPSADFYLLTRVGFREWFVFRRERRAAAGR